nr:NUDIX domain-containing protein [uncultured Acetatifactor sp.]
MLEKTFGIKKPDTIYKERTGAYGIGFSADGKIPVAMTHLYNGEIGYFLLGGGIENNESHIDCIIREALEEAGLSVMPQELVCKGDYYHWIEQTKTDFHGVGYFYYMEIGDIVSEPTEPDHYLVWLTFEQIKEKLFLPHQIWAVEQVRNICRLRA